MTLTDDQLNLFDRVLYQNAFDGQNQNDGGLIPIGYAEIKCFSGAGWLYCTDGLHRNPLFYHPAPLIDEGYSASNHVEASNEIAITLENSLPDFSKSGIEGSDRPNFEYGDRVRAQAVKSGAIVEGVIVSLGHKFAHLDDSYDGVSIHLDSAELLSPGLAHQISQRLFFGGQDQDKISDKALQSVTASVFGEYWVEKNYKTIKGKTYGPYLVQRWRDDKGKKRSRYLGKAPKETTAHGQPDSDQPPHISSGSVNSSAP